MALNKLLVVTLWIVQIAEICYLTYIVAAVAWMNITWDRGHQGDYFV
jgi:hypothetical protein